ncbi:hypothetical protein LX95_02865 [Mesonia algae]|uniref:Lipoprotein n=1 Tax=Mesonia algae TaxID=213248 RepID=A0A2W7II22_9FLAO|nr:hypothetical protein [Mesonia algae]PZW37629.1 hypothetical protein LX95_02865 [Mesonia algae]
MRKITLLLIGVTFLVSCGNNKEEQMLYDYQQKNAKSLNFDLEDLNFEIDKVEKVADIKASDSLKVLKVKLAEYWTKNPEQSLIDTLNFEYVKNVLNKSITQQDTLYKSYQELVLSAIRRNDISSQYRYKRERDNAMDEKLSNQKTLIEIESLEEYYNQLADKPDSILSTKFTAKYSQNNPLLGNTKQTFEKTFYTNSEQTEFVKTESNEKE